MLGWGGGENQGSRPNPANKTPCGEGCRSLALCWGAAALLKPPPPQSPFSFCLLSSLSAQAGAAGLSWCRRRLQSSERAVRGNALPSRKGGGRRGGECNPSEATSSRSSARCTFPTPSLSIALTDALLGGLGLGRSQGQAGRGQRRFAPGRGLGWKGCAYCGARPGAAGTCACGWLLPSFLLPGRGEAGVRAPAAAERALRCGRREPGPADKPGARRAPARPGRPPESSCFSLQLSRPAGERAPYSRRGACREPCALSLFWPSSLGGGEEGGTAVSP